MSFEPEGSTLLTLVADPQRVIHTITGLLPPTALTVPNEFVTPALERIAVTFRLGPLLNDRAAVAMPLPALQDGSWSWLQYEGTLDPAVEISVTGADGTAHLPDALPIAREGWLKLMLHAAPTELTYSIVPQAVRCTADAPLPYSATFQVSAYNGRWPAGRNVEDPD